tara:strand:+ start:191 stop:865 length:675 start_codon:yes stop_codon:yes gene_type:complete
MKQGLTPYMLALGPIAMFIGFSLWPGGGTDDSILLGDAYLEDVKNVDMNMLYLSILITATGILMIFGGFFLLSQDLMANSGKIQQDLFMMSRIGFMFTLTVFYLFFALSLESAFIAQGENDDYASDPALADQLVMDTYYMSMSIWSSMPIAWGTALILFGIAAVTGNNAPKKPVEWAYAVPIAAGIGLITFLWTGGSDAFFFFAIFCAMPVGILMLAGQLDEEG